LIPSRLPKLRVAEMLHNATQSSRLDITDRDIKPSDRSIASEYHIRDKRIQEQIKKFLAEGSMEQSDSLSVSKIQSFRFNKKTFNREIQESTMSQKSLTTERNSKIIRRVF
jgi:hypothetical protein